MVIDEQVVMRPAKISESPLNKLFTKVAAAQQQVQHSSHSQTKHNFQQPGKHSSTQLTTLMNKNNPQPQSK